MVYMHYREVASDVTEDPGQQVRGGEDLVSLERKGYRAPRDVVKDVWRAPWH